MPKLIVVVADPSVRTMDRADTSWILLGGDAADWQPLAGDTNGTTDLESRICQRVSDATIIKLRRAGGRPVVLDMWKGLTSSYEAFYAVRRNGDVLVSDHFRNIVALLPPEERAPSEEAIVDHFLFRSVYGDGSYCKLVKRAGHGEHVTVDLASGRTTARVFVRMVDQAEQRPMREHVERLNQTLEDVLAPLRPRAGVANQFSGGIDSTLVQTYLKPTVPALNIVPDTPEFRCETEYAERAAGLLGIPLDQMRVREGDYARELEQTIEAMGMPPNHEVMALERPVYESSGHRQYVIGQFAGSVFGKDGSNKTRLGWLLRSAPGRLALEFAAGLTRRRPALHHRLETLEEIARSLNAEPGSPSGFAGQHLVWADRQLVDRLFGPHLIRDRLIERVAYAARRVRLFAPEQPRLFRHIELDQWVETFSDPMLPDRHLANAYGKTVFTPYAAGPVVQRAFEVPVRQRYLRGFQAKHLLKQVLNTRLPSYPVNQPKLGTGLPFVRYYTNGPLSKIWDRYDVPELFRGEARQRVVAHPSWTTWNAITWAIWQEKVVRNAALAPIAGSLTLEWSR